MLHIIILIVCTYALLYVGENCFQRNDCTGSFSVVDKVHACCLTDNLSYEDNGLCIPCDSISKWEGDVSRTIVKMG